MNNIKEFKELIGQYENLTLSEIEEEWIDDGRSTMYELTGFGGCYSCSLCRAVGNKACGSDWYTDPNGQCKNCVYIKRGTDFAYPPCVEETYEDIDNAKSPQELYDAIQARIEFMKEILKSYEE